MYSLKEFLRAASPEEREKVAADAGTSVAYLYQLAGGHRKNPSVGIAVGIERATKRLHAANSALPVVTSEALAAGTALQDFEVVESEGGDI